MNRNVYENLFMISSLEVNLSYEKKKIYFILVNETT